MPHVIRDAWRGLRAAPRTTILATAILTVGIAAATTTFSVVDAIALRRLPLPEPDSLVAIARLDRGTGRPGTVAPQDFFTWQEQVAAFEGLAAGGPWSLNLTQDGATERLVAFRITANLFDVLRTVPALGRAFTTEHERLGQDKVVILSHETWQRHFGGDPDIVGRAVAFGNESRVVLGVMPRGFTYPIGPSAPAEAWVPHVPRAADREHGFGGRSYYLDVVGRLRPGTTIALAQQQVAAATAAVIAAYPQQVFWKDSRPIVTSLHDAVVGPAKTWLVLVLGAVALVLLIAYVNVANLLLARSATRAREFAVRTALGASRGQVARVLVVESLILSLAAAGFGLLLAIWGVSIATASLPAGLARASEIALDVRILWVSIAAAVLTGVCFGMIPAWHGSRVDVMTVMKHGGSVAGGGGLGARWHRLLLVAELAFVVTLLFATALFVTSFINVIRTDLGFDRSRLMAYSVSRALPAAADVARASGADAFVTEVLARAKAVPGVIDAALLDGGLPLFGNVASYSITVDGYGKTLGADSVAYKEVTPNYFAVTGTRLISGSIFEAARGGPPVVILNQEAARRFFSGRDPVGEYITFRERTRVVGVVSSVRMSGPEGELRPEMYLPLGQYDMGRGAVSGDVVVRFSESSLGASAAVANALKAFTRTGQPPVPRNLDEQFRVRTAGRRFNAGLMTTFGVLALVMAAAGVYGLTSFIVEQQTRAIGVRLAIGATSGRIFRDVLTDTGRMIVAGVALGLFGGWVASRLLTSVVFGVTGGEPWLYALVVGILAMTGLLASLIPARRASRIDPLVALRTD